MTIDTQAIELALEPYAKLVENPKLKSSAATLYLRGFYGGMTDAVSQWRQFAFANLPRIEPKFVQKDTFALAADMLKRWKTTNDRTLGYLDGFDLVTRSVLRNCGIEVNNPAITDPEVTP